jgi:multiple sugar transport system substrate-binding protein
LELNSNGYKLSSFIGVALAIILLSNLLVYPVNIAFSSPQQTDRIQQKKEQITLRVILTNLGDPIRWNALIQPALQELRNRHPNLDIQIAIDANNLYNNTRMKLINALSNQSGPPIDLVSVDQIWLGEFAKKGLVTNLTDRVQKWGHLSDWYQSNLDGSLYNNTIYGIWAWTDVRGIWYWKDLLNEAGINSSNLETWQGYIESAKKLNNALKDREIQGTILFDAALSPDLWYPYLWMLGGNIIELKGGHPTKGAYWFPAYNGTEGVRAMQFIKEQAGAGIKPENGDLKNLDEEFAQKKFAIYLGGQWIPHWFPPAEQKISNFEEKIGFIPMFPVPNKGNQTSTMMGGWILSIPTVSENKELAWELITIMLEPRILAPWLAEYLYLPTQKTIGEGNYSKLFERTLPYSQEMLSLIEIGHGRPTIPEYPSIAEHIRQAINEVQYGIKEPKQALDDAAMKSAKALGW